MDNKCYLFFSGYNSVATASDMLSRYHIDNKIVRAPATMNKCCSFAILIGSGNVEMAKAILADREWKIVCE